MTFQARGTKSIQQYQYMPLIFWFQEVHSLILSCQLLLAVPNYSIKHLYFYTSMQHLAKCWQIGLLCKAIGIVAILQTKGSDGWWSDQIYI